MYPYITHYMVYLENQKRIKKPIAEISWLEDHLRHEGIHSLRRLMFQFDRPTPSYYYPYSSHNVVLEKTPFHHFQYCFYHYYNAQNERVDIPVQQQYYDVCAVEHLFRQRPVLFYYLGGGLSRSALPLYPLSQETSACLLRPFKPSPAPLSPRLPPSSR